jgi:hypothetical protein
VYLAKDTEMRTSDILQREQRHLPACTTSSSSTTCNTAHSWRRIWHDMHTNVGFFKFISCILHKNNINTITFKIRHVY